VTHLLGRYALTPRWTSHPTPVPAQIGGVARAADACPVDYVTLWGRHLSKGHRPMRQRWSRPASPPCRDLVHRRAETGWHL